MMAKSYGLEEFEKTLEENLRSQEGYNPEMFAETEKYQKKGKALLPLRPIYTENDANCNIFDLLINYRD